MTHPNFTILTDPGRKLIRITMRGFWDTAAITAYDTEIRTAAARMMAAGCRRDEMLALVDTRDLNAQAQDQVAAYKEQFSAHDRQPRRLATIVSSALLKRQIERIALPNQRIFEDEDEALHWLLG